MEEKGKIALINFWKNKQQPQFIKLQCKLCNHEDDTNNYKILRANDIFYAGNLIRYQCPNCDVIFGDMRFLSLTKKEIEKDYENLYSYYKETDPANGILYFFNKLKMSKSKKYLDWGCGNNPSTLSLLNNQGYNVFGYDKYTNNPHHKFLKNIDNKFDMIYSNNFIEHVIDPISDLKEVLDNLKSDGILILISPCWDYCYEFTHFHTFFFVNKSVKVLCDKLNISEIYSNKESDNSIIKIFKKNQNYI